MKSRKGSPGGKPSALVGLYVEWWRRTRARGDGTPLVKIIMYFKQLIAEMLQLERFHKRYRAKRKTFS
jgi:hypothetical protein